MKILPIESSYCNDYPECKLDIYTPDTNNFETIIWFHGGGLETGSRKDAEKLAEGFLKAGYAFVSVEYRMYPNAKFPDYLVDCAKAVAFVKKNVKAYGGIENGIYVSGSSAGAWIALMLCLNEEYLNNEGVRAQDISGWLIESAQTTSHFNVLKYEKGENPKLERINEFAPLYYVSEKTNFTKIFLFFYDRDILCRYEQNMLFYKSVLAFNKNADITYQVLKGTHCRGSNEREEDGEFAFVKALLECLEHWKGEI